MKPSNKEIREYINQLTNSLNQASKAYYLGEDELMTDSEWDSGFQALQHLEAKYPQYQRKDSPTNKVGYQL